MKDTVTRYTNDVIASSAFGIEINSLKDKENEFFKLGKMAFNFGGLTIFKMIAISLFPRLMKVSNIIHARNARKLFLFTYVCLTKIYADE